MGKDKNERKLLRYTSVGVEFTACVVIGLFLGNYLDQRLQTTPWLTFLFLALGFVAGVRALLRTTQQMNQESETEESKDAHGD